MKKILAIMATGLLLASCSNDDHNADADFYGLNQGRVIAYKKYSIDELTGTEQFTGAIDTVTVTAKEKLAGLTYFRLHHRVYKGSVLQEESDDYRRIDSNGYLIDENGIVVHPGFDLNYTYTENLNVGDVDYGTVTYKLGEIKDEVVEGQVYKVYPYIGTISPLPNTIPGGLGLERNYQGGLGLVRQKTRYISGQVYLEDRLVYYKL